MIVLRPFLKYINTVIYTVSRLPHASEDVYGIDIVMVVLYYLLVASVYFIAVKGNKRCKFMCLILSGAIAFAGIGTEVYHMHFLRVDFINVGQGDAALVRIPFGESIVIDGGGSSAVSKRDFGEEIFVPYLKKNGVNKIDYAVLSHYDKDHAQGIAAVLNMMEVDNLILPFRPNGYKNEYKAGIEKLAAEKKINIMYFKEGNSLTLGDVRLDAYAPTLNHAQNSGLEENEKSLVLKMTYGDTSFLFTGDIGKTAEAKLVNYGEKINCDVLKVAHHGSKTATNTKFVMTTTPEYAIISAKRDNAYGLPSARVINSLLEGNVRIYSTAYSGSVKFFVSRKKVERIETFYNTDGSEEIYMKSGEDGV